MFAGLYMPSDKGLLDKAAMRIDGRWINGSAVAELADDGVELFEGKALIRGGLVVHRCAVHHFQDVVVTQVRMNLLCNCLKLLEVHHPVLVLVVEREHLLDAVLGLGLTHSGADDVKEFGELDGLVLVAEALNEVEDEGVALVEAELIKDLVDFGGVDCAAAVLVEDFEGLLEFFVVLRREAFLPGELGLLGFRGSGLGLGCSAHLNLKYLDL